MEKLLSTGSTELQLAWCKSLAVVTKKDTQMEVLSPSLLPLKARSAAALPELELSLSCAFRRATRSHKPAGTQHP